MDNYIEFKNIKKAFIGQLAVKNVSFSIRKGEIHALLGENGAGKTTLLNILHGLFPATEGEIFIGGKKVEFFDSKDAIKEGIAKVHQEINLVPEMTVMQNIMLGDEKRKGILLNKKQMYQETEEILKKLKCKFNAKDKVSRLNTGEKQMLQIAKALKGQAKIISFDEPTSSLSNNEVKTLFSIIKELKSQGITVIYISHKLDEIYELCDRATIMRDGEYINTFEIKGLDKSVLIKNMVGRDVEMFAKRQKPLRANYLQTVLSVEHISGKEGYEDISFNLYKGEILGFFGLVGAKRTEMMKGIFGATPLIQGKIYKNNKEIKNCSPYNAISHSIGFLPENRKEEGFIKDLNNTDNMALASLDYFERNFFQNKKQKYKNALEKGKRVGLMPNDPDFITRNLSGGNQQKVIVGKWLTTNADILIFDEPTKGIDVGSKADIYAIMEELLEEGKSIIMISSELPEIIGMSDRIIVMHEGKITGVLKREEFNEAEILLRAVGGKE
ncbi:sugar ABC transporter ATP-binding protein [Clostridiales bacterium COT073_COT-073]|nr:sugar ABC transporter ATP-binding protein [Clostridiales bacterium COT073_COT-073]